MKSKLVLGAVGILVVVLILAFSAYSSETEPVNKTTLSVYADNSPITVGEFADEIKTHSHFNGYNETTFEWLKSQDGVVFSSENAYVVMSGSDANKLPLEFATDVIVTDTFTCQILEQRPLGEDLRDIISVDHVEFESQKIESAWV